MKFAKLVFLTLLTGLVSLCLIFSAIYLTPKGSTSQAMTINGGSGVVSGQTWKLAQDLVETQFELETLKTQNMDLLDENIFLRLENESLKAENQLSQQKSEEYLQQARFHLCRYHQQRDYGTYNSSCLGEMEGHQPSFNNKDKSRPKSLRGRM